MNKAQFGQFYTTQASKILKGFKVPNDVPIIEPFCGNGDLLKVLGLSEAQVECYDIDPSPTSEATKRDSFLNPPVYTNKFIITNPPFLRRGFAKNKKVYNLYGQDDLYKCFIVSVLEQKPALGGIFILPFNFIANILARELRDAFLDVYQIQRLNIFEEQVFEDTPTAICSFQFVARKNNNKHISTYYYPSGEHEVINLNDVDSIYDLPISNDVKVSRIKRKDPKMKKYIKLEAFDPISLSIVSEKDVDIYPSRSIYYIKIEPKLNNDQQEILIDRWNALLSRYRKKYHSLFLGTFRDQRKYINFNLAKNMIKHILLRF